MSITIVRATHYRLDNSTKLVSHIIWMDFKYFQMINVIM